MFVNVRLSVWILKLLFECCRPCIDENDLSPEAPTTTPEPVTIIDRETTR